MCTVLVTLLSCSILVNVILALRNSKLENFIMAERNDEAYRMSSLVDLKKVKNFMRDDEQEANEGDEIAKIYSDAIMRGTVGDEELTRLRAGDGKQ
jgi:hypothetical protein